MYAGRLISAVVWQKVVPTAVLAGMMGPRDLIGLARADCAWDDAWDDVVDVLVTVGESRR